MTTQDEFITGVDDSETALCRRASFGDGDALSQLLLKYGPSIREFVRGRLPDRFRSLLSEDDVMQETYADAFLSIVGYEPIAPFESWLRQIAVNNLRDAVRGLTALCRGGERQNVGRLSGSGHEWLIEHLSDGGTTPSHAAARNELSGALNQALDQLPDAYREVVRMYDLELRPVEQVSRTLQCSQGAVFMRRARALRMLRDLLGTLSAYC